MSLYIDTSALLKLFFVEPESARAAFLVQQEPQIVVSSLTRLETLVQIQGRSAGGLITPQTTRNLIAQVKTRLQSAPFEMRDCSGALIAVAEKQIAKPATYCPTLDRLHLAAMESFRLRRLLTNDDAQAAAARALGFEVILPR